MTTNPDFSNDHFELPPGDAANPKKRHRISYGVYRKAQQEGSADHLKMIRLNTEIFVPMVLNAGGTVYPPHAPVLTPAQWQQHYGPIWPKLAAAKKHWDPKNILTPGAGIF